MRNLRLKNQILVISSSLYYPQAVSKFPSEGNSPQMGTTALHHIAIMFKVFSTNSQLGFQLTQVSKNIFSLSEICPLAETQLFSHALNFKIVI